SGCNCLRRNSLFERQKSRRPLLRTPLVAIKKRPSVARLFDAAASASVLGRTQGAQTSRWHGFRLAGLICNQSDRSWEQSSKMLSGRPLAVDASSRGSKAKNGRSRVTNHRDLLPHIADGRQTQARRFRDLVRAFISDAGGIENCSEVKLGLARRLA